MNDKIEFQWGLYVGKHMGNNALRVKYTTYKFDENNEQIGVNKVYIEPLYSVTNTSIELTLDFSILKKNCTPQLKSLDSLSNEEWLFVFGFDPFSHEINKSESEIYVNVIGYYNKTENVFNVDSGYFGNGGQQILNRLYSLHRSPDEKALLDAGLIEIVE